MKHTTCNTVQQFGRAKWIRHRNGRHELIGGCAADHTAAIEWVSLFVHEIVFSNGATQLNLNGCIRRPNGPGRFGW